MTKAQFTRHQPVKAKTEDEYDFVKTQENMEDFVADVYDKGPILDGQLIEGVSLSAYTNKDIEHKLGKSYRGWFIAKQKASICDIRAYIDSAQTIPTATTTDVHFDTQSYDVGGCFDPATGFVTTPHRGYYDVSALVTMDISLDAKSIHLALHDGTSTLVRGGRSVIGAATFAAVTIAARVRINANKPVRLQVYHNAGVNRDTLTASWNFFMMRAVDELIEGTSPDDTKFLRLLSSRDRTVDLWVF